MKLGGKVTRIYKTLKKKVIPRVNLRGKNRVTFQTKRSLACTNLPFLSLELLKKLAHRKLVGVVILDNKAILRNKRPRPTAKHKTLEKKSYLE